MSSVVSLHKDISTTIETRTKYRLLELPSDLCKLIEANTSDLRLSIKGKEGDDAVICTANKTYALRTVHVSNSMIVATGSGSSASQLILGDEIHEIMEMLPSVPKLERLNALLKGSEYGEDFRGVMSEEIPKSLKWRKYTRRDVNSIIQASDAELANALRSNHILEIDGYLRPLPQDYLSSILKYIFTSLISYGLPRTCIPASRLIEVVQEDHEVPVEVTSQVMQWYGRLEDGVWRMDESSAIRQVGIGLLKPHIHEPIAEALLMAKWKEAVGDAFSDLVNMKLLRGEYLLHSNSSGAVTISYFSRSRLPLDPLARFNELFLTRNKWTESDIVAFLEDIAVDKKDCDRLLLKFARRSTGTDGIVYYTARAGHI